MQHSRGTWMSYSMTLSNIIQGSHTFSSTKFKDFSRTFQGLFKDFLLDFMEHFSCELWTFEDIYDTLTPLPLAFVTGSGSARGVKSRQSHRPSLSWPPSASHPRVGYWRVVSWCPRLDHLEYDTHSRLWQGWVWDLTKNTENIPRNFRTGTSDQ